MKFMVSIIEKDARIVPALLSVWTADVPSDDELPQDNLGNVRQRGRRLVLRPTIVGHSCC